MVRKELNEFLDTYGLPAKYIAKVLGISYTNFIKFKNDQYNLGEENILKLKNYMDNYKEAMKSV